MTTYRILIVEDEVLISDMIARYLNKMGHEVIGQALSYEEATQLYTETKPDIALLDIRLNGAKTGIDVAQFIQEQTPPIPFIYLTSQLDSRSINQAKETFPEGYLSKPIQKESLYTTIEMAMHRSQQRLPKKKEPTIQLNNGIKPLEVPIKDILYLQADHIYVKIHIAGMRPVLQRCALKELLERLPAQQFVQTHRSFAINIKQVSHWDSQSIYLNDLVLPLSRSRRKTVHSYLALN